MDWNACIICQQKITEIFRCPLDGPGIGDKTVPVNLQLKMQRDLEKGHDHQKSKFQFWDTILHFELLGLLFIRAHREANFHLYVDSLKALVPWFFCMDHHNYARWISVHIRDMENLPPTTKEELEQHGHWVVFKTTNRFRQSQSTRPMRTTMTL